MVLLGLGSNRGDRAGHLASALRALRGRGLVTGPLRISRAYASKALLPAGAPADWDRDFLNIAIEAACPHAPEALLEALQLLEGEHGRGAHEPWSPRTLDIDILFWDEFPEYRSERLKLPHPGALKRPFVLKPLVDLRPDWTPPGAARRLRDTVLADELGTRPVPLAVLPAELAGVLNITPDSFSDGGAYESPQAALEQARALVEGGAAMLDLGAESTRPGGRPVTAGEEWARLEPIAARLNDWLRREHPWVRWSIDTRHAATARRALEHGAAIVNDVSGGEDPAMLPLVGEAGCRYVFMHHCGIPVDPAWTLPPEVDAPPWLLEWAREKRGQLLESGLDAENLLFDPGIGFGKSASQSVAILRRLEVFQPLGLPLYLGPSRKSFLKLVTDVPAAGRDLETAALCSTLAASVPRFGQVACLRVHQPDWAARALRTALLLTGDPAA